MSDQTGGMRLRADSYTDFQQALMSDPSFVEALVERTPECIKVVAPDGTLLQMNRAGVEMCGASEAGELIGRCTYDLIADEFRDEWIANHLRICAGERLIWEFDIVGLSGERRHMETHAVPVALPTGATAQLALTRDITERKRDEARQRALANEVNHRANNLLAVVQGVVRLTDASSPTDLKQSIEGRISALAHAHGLLAKTTWQGADIAQLVEAELAPFRSGDPSSVQAQGPRVVLSPSGAQSLAMIVHELATNAVKYGALSSEGGSLRVRWSLDEARLNFCWIEAGQSASKAEPERVGLGARVIDSSAAQLRGRVTRRWAATGLEFQLIVDRELACSPLQEPLAVST